MNEKLKAQVVMLKLTQKQLAGEMGVSYSTFKAKVNHNKRPNSKGKEAFFNKLEKEWLAERLSIDPDLIE